jgi:ATP-dependent Clp protease ATP-binding subunit ClpC
MATPSVGTGPFDRFTDRGKLVLALAQDEAIRHNHNYIGTEHLLSALLRDTDSIAARALSSLGIELTKVRTALEFIIGRGNQPTSPSEITLSPRTKKVIELSIDEARKLGHSHLGPEHVLLGLAREGEGVASGILESLGVSMAAARAKVLELLKESGS